MKLSIELEEKEIINAVMYYLSSKGYQVNKENIYVDGSVWIQNVKKVEGNNVRMD